MNATLALLLAGCLASGLALPGPAQGGGGVFLSNDLAQSEATYVIQFVTKARGHIDKLAIALPAGTNASTVTLGRFIVGHESGEDSGNEVAAERLSVPANAPDTLVVDLKGSPSLQPGTTVFLELFNLHNPGAGAHSIQVAMLDRRGQVVEMIEPIGYWTYTSGISAVTPGFGLLGGGDKGAVALSVDTSRIQMRVNGRCDSGWAMTSVNADGSVFCQRDQVGSGTISGVTAGSGLAGGAAAGVATLYIPTGGVTSTHIANGTIAAEDVNSSEVQLRVGWYCPAGSSIRQINPDGTVLCDPGSGSGTQITASAPLLITTASAPNISLPNVMIEPSNTAVGTSALGRVTFGTRNTATGANALANNLAGNDNTASGFNALAGTTTGNSGSSNTAHGSHALFSNSGGGLNTATGSLALFSNGVGGRNTASGANALQRNTSGSDNTATGANALSTSTTGTGNTATGSQALLRGSGSNNTANGFQALGNGVTMTGSSNTAMGFSALAGNTAGNGNTAVGAGADVSFNNLTNATAIGAGARVDDSNKVRIGNGNVTVIEGAVGFSAVSDRTKKENFQPVDGEEVLKKLRGLTITSWNYIGQDPKRFRHYGPVAQEFYAAFGHDGVGTIGTPTTITSTDMDGILMIAVLALEQRTAELKAREARIKALESRVEALEREIGSHAVPAKVREQ